MLIYLRSATSRFLIFCQKEALTQEGEGSITISRQHLAQAKGAILALDRPYACCGQPLQIPPDIMPLDFPNGLLAEQCSHDIIKSSRIRALAIFPMTKLKKKGITFLYDIDNNHD